MRRSNRRTRRSRTSRSRRTSAYLSVTRAPRQQQHMFIDLGALAGLRANGRDYSTVYARCVCPALRVCLLPFNHLSPATPGQRRPRQGPFLHPIGVQHASSNVTPFFRLISQKPPLTESAPFSYLTAAPPTHAHICPQREGSASEDQDDHRRRVRLSEAGGRPSPARARTAAPAEPPINPRRKVRGVRPVTLPSALLPACP